MEEGYRSGISEQELLEEMNTLIEMWNQQRESDAVYNDAVDCLEAVVKSQSVSQETAKAVAQNLAEHYRRELKAARSWERITALAELYEKYFPDSQTRIMRKSIREIADMQKDGSDTEEEIMKTLSSSIYQILEYNRGRKENGS